MEDLDEKRQMVCGSKPFIVIVESGCVKPYPLSQDEPAIKYLCRKGILSEKGILLAMLSGALSTSLALRSLSWAYVTIGYFSFPVALIWDVRHASSKCGRAWGITLMWLMATNIWGGSQLCDRGLVFGSRRRSFPPFRPSRATKTLAQLRTRIPLIVHCPTSLSMMPNFSF